MQDDIIASNLGEIYLCVMFILIFVLFTYMYANKYFD